MTNASTSEFLRVVDHAAAMNDRWLFLAAFCLLLLGCGAVIYWLVKQLQSVLAGHKQARDTHQVALTQIIATQNETALKLAVCIDRNTAAMEDCTIELRRIREHSKPESESRTMNRNFAMTHPVDAKGQPLPACVGIEEAARFFGWPLYFFPVLMRTGHLKPLGKPTQNARKWFATCELERLSRDPDWLDKAIRLVEKHVRDSNDKQRGKAPRGCLAPVETSPEQAVLN